MNLYVISYLNFNYIANSPGIKPCQNKSYWAPMKLKLNREWNLKPAKQIELTSRKQNIIDEIINQKALNLSKLEKRNKSEWKQYNFQKSHTRKSILPYLSPDQNEIFQRFALDEKLSKISSSRIKNKSIIRALNEQRVAMNANSYTQYQVRVNAPSDPSMLVVKGKTAGRQADHYFNVYS